MRARDTRISDLETEGALYYSDGYRTRRDELSPSGYRVLRAGDINYGRIAVSGLDHVHVSREKQIGLKRAVDGDVVLTTKGTVGRVALVQGLAEQKVVYSPQLCFFRVLDPEVIDPRYLRVALESPELTAQMSSYSGNSDMAPYLNLRDIGALRVPLPDLVDQHAIAEVLGALDDKIAANRRVMDIVGEVQQVLWLKSARGTELVPLTEVAKIHLGGTPPRADEGSWGGDIAWASVKDMSAAEAGIITRTAETISASASNGAPRLGTLPPGTTFLSARGTVGLVSTNALPCAINQSAYALIADSINPVVLRLSVSSLARSLRSRAHGSVFSTITSDTLRDSVIPDLRGSQHSVLARQLDALEALRVARAKENTVLASTRDELLPLLMSGKITVRGAEQVVEEVL